MTLHARISHMKKCICRLFWMSREIDKDIKLLDLGIKDINFGRKKFADNPIESPSQRRVSSPRENMRGRNQTRQRLTDATARTYKGAYINACIHTYIHTYIHIYIHTSIYI